MALQKAILEAKEKKITTLLISHSPNFLQVTDKLLILVGGAVAAFGPRDEVMKAIQKQQQSATSQEVLP